ncbi:MAG: prolipoprotein diacylglyceryl transferase [Nanoarchaeota archaeon]
MFYHKISPFIVRISHDFGIRWYGLIYVLGFILVYAVLRSLARKNRIKNLTEERVDILILYLIVGDIIGARLFHVFVFEFSYYKGHLLDIFKIWQGGLSFHGALVGTIVVTWYFCRKYRIKFYDIADAIVFPVAIALALGRIANFINSELYGKITSLPWCVDYSQNPYLANPPDGCRHPSQLYESLKNFFIFGILYSFKRMKKEYPSGFFFWLFVTLYGVLRFFITFTRDEPPIFGTGIAEAQWLSLLMAIVGGIFLFKILGKTGKKSGTAG